MKTPADRAPSCSSTIDTIRRRAGPRPRVYVRQIEGAGLGLAVAKWIDELRHADLTVAGELRKGTVFQLALPVC
ncbi:MAG: hypothetical protein ACRD3N_17905 [Terracidiphilus sp.]